MDVLIELIDDATGETFAESEVPLDSLPQYFARMDTRLTVGDAEWVVVRADPASRDEIGREGRARLRLRRAAAVSPKDVLYSLPSIEDVLPERGPAPEGTEALTIEPDDYRQVELVRDALSTEVDVELDDVRRVLSGRRKGAGFDEIHVRKRVPSPLDGARVTLAEVEAAAGAKSRPLALRGQHGAVKGGFAIPLADGMIYGVERDGALTTLGLHGAYDEAAGLLHPVALAHRLALVDWCGARRLRALDEGFAA